jgi:hypothetical protein
MRSAVLFLAALACGCEASSEPSEPGPAATRGDSAPLSSCNAGARPVATSGACEAVGTTDVPPGFTADAWGFSAVLPASACTGATIAELGETACAPLDDCSAAFPPKDADVVVRADKRPVAGRPELPVVATLADALAAAPIKGKIAVDEGEYLLPEAITKSARLVGRCAERTALRGEDFGAKPAPDVEVDFTSLAFTGAPKVALLVNKGAKVALDRVWIHGVGNGALVGNGASLRATRTVFDGPAEPHNPNAATSALYATYGGAIAAVGVEIRGYQNAVLGESVGSDVAVTRSVIHEQRSLGAEPEALSVVGAFLGARVAFVESHVEAGPGRIAMVGAARLDGKSDPTSPGDPPASLQVTRGTLLQTGFPREAGSGIDVVEGASLVLDDVTLHHDCFTAIGTSEDGKATLKSSVIVAEPNTSNARIGVSAIKRATIELESTAIVGSSQFAILLDDASRATLTRSLVERNHEVGLADFVKFMGAAQAIAIAPGGYAKIVDSAFVANEGSSIFLERSTADIEHTVFAGTVPSAHGPLSAAITALSGTLAMRGVKFAKNDRALALRSGRALLRDSDVVDNREALRLEDVALFETGDAVEESVDQKLVAARTTFVRNTVLLSSKSLTAE